jgi:hypothetical protein
LGTVLTTGLGTTGASEDDVFVLSRRRVGRDLIFAVRRNQFPLVRGVWGTTGSSSVLILFARSITWSRILANAGGYTERGMTGEQMSILQIRRGAFGCVVATNGCQGVSGGCLVCSRSRRLLWHTYNVRGVGSNLLGVLTKPRSMSLEDY